MSDVVDSTGSVNVGRGRDPPVFAVKAMEVSARVQHVVWSRGPVDVPTRVGAARARPFGSRGSA